MIFHTVKYSLFIFLLIITNSSKSQEGNYFITNYTSADYNGPVQNFDITQNDFGTLYFANNGSIIEYNGKTWEQIVLTEAAKTPASFAKTKNDLIYVGGENEIGYLEKNNKGKIFYKSIVNLLKEEEKDFSTVWSTLIINDDVYYCANERIIRYSNGKITSWKPKTAYHKAQVINGVLLVREIDNGLMFLNKDKFERIENSEIFAPSDYKISFFLPYNEENEFLIFTRKKGIYHFKLNKNDVQKSKIQKFTDKRAYDILKDCEPYDGLILKNKNRVIGTIDKGIFVFDENGILLQSINSASGLISNECRKLFIDKQSNLWIAFNSGISKVEINSPLKKWDNANGIEGSVESFIKYKNKNYIATAKGLMVFNPTSKQFNYVSEITDKCHDLCEINGFLFVATAKGLYSYDSGKFKLIYDGAEVYKIKYEPDFSKQMFCGTETGIIAIDPETKQMLNEINSPLNSPNRYLAFLSNNSLLVSTRSEGLYQCDLTTKKTSILPKDKNFKTTSNNYILNHKGAVYMGTDSGIFMINKNLKLVPFEPINKFLNHEYSVLKIAFYKNELFLTISRQSGPEKGNEENLAFNLTNSKTISPTHLSLVKAGEIGSRQFYFSNDTVYVQTDEGVFILNRTQQIINTELRPLISKIIHNTDTLFYNLQNNKDSLIFDYGTNKFVFEFGSNDYSGESKLQFQYYLSGSEIEYSNWTPNNKAYYDNRNLKEGEYIFYLKAKNIYGQISKELYFKFKILPPWYRTNTAYVVCVLLGLVLIVIIVKLNSKRLVSKNKRLEKIIADRTQTITHQKLEIEHKNKEMTDSINYAQKIQLALMANKKILDKNLTNNTSSSDLAKKYFILYNPKDIVSGDFYWVGEVNLDNEKHVILVTADCTGHGVPGAFMSLLCIGFLNEITKEKKITDPGKIFDELRLRIISTLNPDGSETERKDGMDAVILNINSTNKIISYAAANNSFYVVRNKELLVLKADKMPVGKYGGDTLKPFTTQTFEIQKNDMLYAFTDGYADQFGGPKGKKFKYKQLEELMIDICNMEPEIQKEILDKRFKEWQLHQEQVDDVLIVGIQF